MSDQPTTAALAGTAGGAGATRLAVEVGATLARAGRSVALLDAAFATQGLAQHVPGRIDEDVVDLVTGDDPRPSDAAVDLQTDTSARLVAVPARAPFQAFARAKTAGGATSGYERRVTVTRRDRARSSQPLTDSRSPCGTSRTACSDGRDPRRPRRRP